MAFVQSPEPNGVVYMIRNKVNGKMYIGQTIAIKRRLVEHFASNVAHSNPLFKRDLNDMGVDCFDIEILAEAPKSGLTELENVFIEKHRSFVDFDDSNGYNLQFRSKQSKKFKKHRSQLMRKNPGTVIVCINTGDEFDTVADAASFCGSTAGSIKAILGERSYQTKSGYRFEYRIAGK